MTFQTSPYQFKPIDEVIETATKNFVPLGVSDGLTLEVFELKGQPTVLTSGGVKLACNSFAFASLANNHLNKRSKEVKPGTYELDKKFIIKTDGESLYQAFTDRYTPLADYQLLEQLKAKGFNEVRYRPNYYSSITEVRIPNGNKEFEPMLFVKNSEMGCSSLIIYQGTFRMICTNGLVIADRLFYSFNQKHTGKLEFKLDVAPEYFEQLYNLKKYELGNEVHEERIKKAIQAANIRRVDRKRMPDLIVTELRTQKEDKISLYTITNSLTRLANYTDVNNTWRVQKQASNIVVNPQDFITKLEQIELKEK